MMEDRETTTTTPEKEEEEEEFASRFSSPRRSLKPWSWLFVLSIPTILALMCVWYWQLALVSMTLMLPSGRLFWWWRENRQYAGPLDHVISSYAQGFYVIFVIANVSAFVAFSIAFAVLETAASLVSDSASLHLLVMGCSFAAWVLTEEAWKVTFAFWAKQRRTHVIGDRNRETKAWVSAATATAFGYATSQSILFVIFFTAILSENGISASELRSLFLNGVLFGAISQPLSILTSHLIGLELTRDATPIQAIKWPAAARCAYVFQFFFWIAVFYSVLLRRPAPLSSHSPSPSSTTSSTNAFSPSKNSSLSSTCPKPHASVAISVSPSSIPMTTTTAPTTPTILPRASTSSSTAAVLLLLLLLILRRRSRQPTRSPSSPTTKPLPPTSSSSR